MAGASMELRLNTASEAAGEQGSRGALGWFALDAHEHRCLRGYKPRVACDRCVVACPVGALSATAGGIVATSRCVGCGICASTCPTGSIAIEGFEPPHASAVEVRVECGRVPTRELGTCSWTVPCIAGLRPALLEALDREPGRPTRVTFVDRGLCEACPASRSINAVRSAYERLAADIAATGTAELVLDIVAEPLADASAHPFGHRPAGTRRQFLQRLITPATRPRRFVGLREDRQALSRLAVASGRSLLARHFPSVRVAGACRDHGVCSASCPTGALRREFSDTDEALSLVFDPVQCIGCGRCAEVCPERAVQVGVADTPSAPVAVVILREVRLSTCPRCGDAFAPDDGGDLCPSCRKGDALFRDLFRQQRREPATLAPPDCTPQPREGDI